MWELSISKKELSAILEDANQDAFGGVANLIDTIEYYRAACVSDSSETYRWLTRKLKEAHKERRAL